MTGQEKVWYAAFGPDGNWVEGTITASERGSWIMLDLVLTGDVGEEPDKPEGYAVHLVEVRAVGGNQ